MASETYICAECREQFATLDQAEQHVKAHLPSRDPKEIHAPYRAIPKPLSALWLARLIRIAHETKDSEIRKASMTLVEREIFPLASTVFKGFG